MDDIIIVLPMVTDDTTTIEDDMMTIADVMMMVDDTVIIVEEMSDGGEVVAMIGEQSIEEVVPTREVPRPPPTKTMWTTASDIFPTTDRGHCWDRDTKL